MKVITISGSMRFEKQMQQIAYDLEKQGNCVIQGVYSDEKTTNLDELKNIMDAHWKKIELCDAVYVVNINGYIGASTREEIEYGKSIGKEIIYHEPVDKNM